MAPEPSQEKPIALELPSPPPPRSAEPLPVPMDLQFERAELSDSDNGRRCAACKQTIPAQYYHAAGQVGCPACADRIQAGQQAPPALSLVKSARYGGGAAFGGFI